MKNIILILFTLVFGANHTFAQDSIANKNLIAKFSGEWYSKKEKQTLVISYDTENNSFLINDHTKGYSEDAYYAYPKNNKLILPAQNSDHHSSYCEISIIKNQLVYECNSALNFTDNFLTKDQYSTKNVFVKKRGE
ncbi:hypothetical protein [Pedobacter agri]|uniref:hypothetical protein n=1 Tax=Pedobacter agri TaxID=454586 RepID=UPI00292DE051|nr:hypothetical protein [Pedobacter agri]